MIKKNTWVQIEKIILNPSNRAASVPSDTKMTPLIMWVKGFLKSNAELGDIVKIKTKTGRIEKGKIVQVHPSFNHSFGNYVEEFERVDRIIQDTLYGDIHE